MESIDKTVHMSKRRNASEDDISKVSLVPNKIILQMLSSLSIKERAQTSVLARRWKYTWLGVVNINIDPKDFVEEYLMKSTRYRQMKKFRKVIDQVMNCDSGINILGMVINTSMDGNTVNLWILRAMRRKVQELSISIKKEDIRPYEFPITLQFCTAFKSLTVEFISFKDLPIYSSLAELTLVDAYFEKDSDHVILPFAGFSSLEKLNIRNCDAPITMSIESPTLKSLTIKEAYNLVLLRVVAPEFSDLSFKRFVEDGVEYEHPKPLLVELICRKFSTAKLFLINSDTDLHI